MPQYTISISLASVNSSGEMSLRQIEPGIYFWHIICIFDDFSKKSAMKFWKIFKYWIHMSKMNQSSQNQKHIWAFSFWYLLLKSDLQISEDIWEKILIQEKQVQWPKIEQCAEPAKWSLFPTIHSETSNDRGWWSPDYIFYHK